MSQGTPPCCCLLRLLPRRCALLPHVLEVLRGDIHLAGDALPPGPCSKLGDFFMLQGTAGSTPRRASDITNAGQHIAGNNG